MATMTPQSTTDSDDAGPVAPRRALSPASAAAANDETDTEDEDDATPRPARRRVALPLASGGRLSPKTPAAAPWTLASNSSEDGTPLLLGGQTGANARAGSTFRAGSNARAGNTAGPSAPGPSDTSWAARPVVRGAIATPGGASRAPAAAGATRPPTAPAATGGFRGGIKKHLLSQWSGRNTSPTSNNAQQLQEVANGPGAQTDMPVKRKRGRPIGSKNKKPRAARPGQPGSTSLLARLPPPIARPMTVRAAQPTAGNVVTAPGGASAGPVQSRLLVPLVQQSQQVRQQLQQPHQQQMATQQPMSQPPVAQQLRHLAQPQQQHPQPSAGSSTKVRRYPKLLAFDSNGRPVAARSPHDFDYPSRDLEPHYPPASADGNLPVDPMRPMSDRELMLLREARGKRGRVTTVQRGQPARVEDVAAGELSRLTANASSKYHMKMNLRGRNKLHLWLMSSDEFVREAVRFVCEHLDIDVRVCDPDELQRKLALGQMRNNKLRSLEALEARLRTSNEGRNNWWRIVNAVRGNRQGPAEFQPIERPLVLQRKNYGPHRRKEVGAHGFQGVQSSPERGQRQPSLQAPAQQAYNAQLAAQQTQTLQTRQMQMQGMSERGAQQGTVALEIHQAVRQQRAQRTQRTQQAQRGQMGQPVEQTATEQQQLQMSPHQSRLLE